MNHLKKISPLFLSFLLLPFGLFAGTAASAKAPLFLQSGITWGDVAELGAVAIIIGIILLIIWIWALVDAIKKHFPTPVEKLLWIALIIFVPVIGVLAYFFVGRNRAVSHGHAG